MQEGKAECTLYVCVCLTIIFKLIVLLPVCSVSKLLSHIKKIKKACEKQSEQCVEESAACSRPHTFLHR